MEEEILLNKRQIEEINFKLRRQQAEIKNLKRMLQKLLESTTIDGDDYIVVWYDIFYKNFTEGG